MSWKTTLTGWAVGGGYLFLTAMQQGLHPRDAAIGVGIALLGTLAKDFDKSHAPVPLPAPQSTTLPSPTAPGPGPRNI